MSGCNISNKKLIALLNDELPTHKKKILENHIQNCSACQILYSELKQTYYIIEENRVLTPNPFLYTRIKQKLNEELKTQYQKNLKPALWQGIKPVLFLALLIFILWGNIELVNLYTNSNSTIISNNSTEFFLNDLEQEVIEKYLLKD
ncbi:MAG: hypothetical protein L3J74_04270 [Bacteroidales bacterium]|nr:hypothetical protein [Bacteroidales bacterium]